MVDSDHYREVARQALQGLAQVLDDARLRITIPDRANVQEVPSGVVFIEAVVEVPVG